MRKPILFASVVTTFAFAAGCSSDPGEGSGPSNVTSIDSSKTVSELSESEARQYCEDSGRYFANQISEEEGRNFGCGLQASITAAFSGAETDDELKANCQKALSECKSQPIPEPVEDDECGEFVSDAKKCNATVEELNHCLADRTAEFKQLATKDFCAELTLSSGGPGSVEEFAEPASCKAIADKCPSFASSTEDDTVDVTEGDGQP